MAATYFQSVSIAYQAHTFGWWRGGSAFLTCVAIVYRVLIHLFWNRLLIGLYCLTLLMGVAGNTLFASEARLSKERALSPPTFVPLRDDRLSRKSVNSSVYAIFQDIRGFLWFGTHIGLLVYDGYHIDQYSPNAQDKTAISDYNVSSIAEDRDGNLWIGTMDSGISLLDRSTDTFSHYRNEPENPFSLSSDDVWCIYRSSSGEMWIGTWGGGLNRYDYNSGEFIRYQANPSDHESLSSDIVNAIFEDHAGNLWIGTNNGLDQYDQKTGRFIHFRNKPQDPWSISDNNVTVIFEDANQTLWIGTGNGGLNRFHPESKQFSRYQHNPRVHGTISSNRITTIVEDEDGSLWVGTIDAGLNRFGPHRETFTHHKQGDSYPHRFLADGIRALYKDQSGLIWVGLENGGALKIKHDRQKFRFHRLLNDAAQLPPSETVTAISGNDQETLWLGTLYGGLIRHDQQSNRLRHYRHDADSPGSLSGNTITAIQKDRDGDLWVGTYAAGLNRFDPEREHFTRYRNVGGNPDSISSDSISALIQDASGNLWIGTRNMGLDRLDINSGRFIHYRHNTNMPKGLSSDGITALCLGGSGYLWIGTKEKGLNRLNPETGTFHHFRNKTHDLHSLSSDKILTLHQDRRGFLWVGTNGGGLNRFDPRTERFVNYRQRDGLADETIRAILEDDYGNLWLKSWDGHITKLNPQTGIFTNFDENSGLRPEQSIIVASYRDDKGRMYFGGPKGYYTFQPYYNTHVPNIQITDFKLFNKSVTPHDERQLLRSAIITTEKIHLTYRDQVFSFEFTALDFTAPKMNHYAYMLEGLDDDWIFSGTQRSALYANIPPGDYQFRVKGSNNDGIWNENGAAITIVMAPPPWKTWWAYALYALSVIGLFIGYGRYRAYKQAVALKREQEAAYRTKLENEVVQRTSELLETNNQLSEEIIERRRAEESLRMSEEKYRSIIETAREGYVMIDENLSIMDVNDEFCKMLKFRRNELIGKTLDTLGVDEFRDFLKMSRGDLFRDGGFEVKGKLSRKGGRPIPVLLHGSVMHSNNAQSMGNVIFVTDLSIGEMSLALAAEVQNSLLNTNELQIEGLDLNGFSRPCADVGGDYFDLVRTPVSTGTSLIAVVGDISGHGVEAALLMTAVRSFLRMRVQQEGSLPDTVADLNRHIYNDISQTYRFMTFFILALDASKNNLEWVRAGHDPAFLYKPAVDEFSELSGKGIALGLNEDYPYQSNTKSGFLKGQIIILVSDGITEACNTKGEMFGKGRLCEVIRSFAHLPAKGITDQIFDAVSTFARGTMPDDDRTLVVIKRT